MDGLAELATPWGTSRRYSLSIQERRHLDLDAGRDKARKELALEFLSTRLASKFDVHPTLIYGRKKQLVVVRGNSAMLPTGLTTLYCCQGNEGGDCPTNLTSPSSTRGRRCCSSALPGVPPGT